MITWGQRANPNTEQTASLGSHASGNVHSFTRYRTAANGASLHPLQRQGVVAQNSHTMTPRMTAASHPGLGESAYPAAAFNMQLPPLVPISGSPRDPGFQV
jgi:hypothetical protein